VWIHIETYLNKESITCPACNETILFEEPLDDDAITELECLCGQALQLHRSTAILTELYAQNKEDKDAENGLKEDEGSTREN
jgi:hypothetical protein